jgi:cysteine desulfurase
MSDTVRVFRDSIEQLILSALPGTIVAGAGALRLPNTTFLLIPAVDTEPLLALLDMEGLCCSSGSACAAGAHEPSHVLKAMGLPTGAGWGSLRISLSRLTTQQDADYLVERVVHVVHHLRAAGASC